MQVFMWLDYVTLHLTRNIWQADITLLGLKDILQLPLKR